MTVEDHAHVRLDGPDGSRWCVVVDRDDDVVTTACGRSAVWFKADDFSPEGDCPDDFSGNTICYGCTRSRSQARLEDGRVDEDEVTA